MFYSSYWTRNRLDRTLRLHLPDREDQVDQVVKVGQVAVKEADLVVEEVQVAVKEEVHLLRHPQHQDCAVHNIARSK